MAKPKVTANQIVELLQEKHAKDVVIPQCKNGPTLTGKNLRILDAWVLRTTWSPWTTIGYEVKVDRADFEADQKWPDYLKLCHQFYFVCPSGLIKATDLPDGVGLMWCSPRAQRLHTKVKAERGEPNYAALTKLMSYVLMWRLAPGDESEPGDRLEEYKRQVERAEAGERLANFVSEHIRKRVDAADDALRKAQRLTNAAVEFAGRLEKLGIVWDVRSSDWSRRFEIQCEIDALDGRIDRLTRRRLRNSASDLVEALDQLEQEGAQESGLVLRQGAGETEMGVGRRGHD